MNIAAIDLGTNTLLMTIAALQPDGSIERIVADEHNIARLGEGVDKSSEISSEAVQRAINILHLYHKKCVFYQVSHISFIATSAMRDATNAATVREVLEQVMGCEIRIIDGTEEARLSFLGAGEYSTHHPTANARRTVIDIGGGSTEFITGVGTNVEERSSFQLGAVRLFERCLRSLPPTPQAIEAARREIRSHLATMPQREIGVVTGVGGTFTTLAAIDLQLHTFEAVQVQGHKLSLEAIRKHTRFLLSSSLEELLANPAIHPKRADILPAGALILEESLQYMGASDCIVSTQGLRYGVLYDLIEQLRNAGHFSSP